MTASRNTINGSPRRRTVSDVMTKRVHVAGPLAPFKQLVRLIAENRVSAIPIVDQQGVPRSRPDRRNRQPERPAEPSVLKCAGPSALDQTWRQEQSGERRQEASPPDLN